MTEQTRNDLKMIGTTATAGGNFRHVAVTGECQITGNVDCEKLSLTGELGIAGDLQADEMKITGQCKVDGRIGGLSIRGQGEIRGSSGMKMEQIKFNGSLVVKGSCEAENLSLNGALDVGELLSAEQLEIGLYGPSRAKEVGGGTIEIKRSTASRIMELVKPRQEAFFEAELIEGDKIGLQYTKANTVRGKAVSIGQDCVINTVEFRDTLEIHKNAIVKQQIKL
ncbi:hypothetical protein PaeBR_11235 [Paenibacillus sp. BR2-3]|uniref:hypothetical protein n=1 Tax=Paenibacillus sp. BR2-3 TaxID=3048494 RepID=UPI0039777C5B